MTSQSTRYRVPIVSCVLLLALVLAACSGSEAPAPVLVQGAAEEPTTEPVQPAEQTQGETRLGAWVDEVIVVEEPSATTAMARLGVGEIDVYAYGVTESEIFQEVIDSADVDYAQSVGSSSELTFNTAGPILEGSGKLNPFAIPRIREAMNWLVDREYIAQEIYGGLAVPRYLAITTAFPDYARLVEVAKQLEQRHAHNPDRASEVITEEMEALGAELVDGIWHYEDEPVELIFLIRTEDERRELGDYVATLLEDTGFVVERDYRTAAEASPIWVRSDPAEGLFHLYTGGWVTTVVSRDQAGNFNFFYTPRGLSFPLWQGYDPAPEFDEIADRLAQRDFRSLQERSELFARALELSMEDSVRIWLVDRLSFSPYRADVEVAADLAGGISGSWLWAHTIRHADRVGDRIDIALPSILPEPWNPLDGSNWIYDMMLARSTGDRGIMPDPFTGLYWPQRIDRAEVYIQEGLPVGKTHDWVELNFVAQNEVPEDALIDWDPVEQRFITVGEKHPEGLTASRKSVAYYPEALLALTWHDGSPFSVADIVMDMILTFDRAKEGSPVFDEAQVPSLETFQDHFRGARIAQEDPLVIEYYSDLYYLDAEQNVVPWFPYYAHGPGAWHTLALGLRAEANNELAFSSDKADELEVEWTSYVAGPSMAILEGHLEDALDEGYIPYAPTLGQYISQDEAQARWENLTEWYNDKGHLWVGTGPFFLEKAFPIEGAVHLSRNPNFPDPADKWSRFEQPMIAEVEIDGPIRVTAGSETIYDVWVNFQDEPYPMDSINNVKYLVFDARGDLALTGEAEAMEDGWWQITLGEDEIARLDAGANRLEVAVVPLVVSVPTFEALEFVTIP